MTVIECIRFSHNEYVDSIIEKKKSLIGLELHKHQLFKVGIVFDDQMESEEVRKIDPWF